uniref:LIM zinc-binding domain-containing protein n=1 Tax=Chrysemys picta bellii TaxID=8478 RepID=A0A8C3HZH6_CHRPI
YIQQTGKPASRHRAQVLGSQCYLTLDLSFQSMMKEVCSSCLQPVSSMECVAANKVLLHHSCFCCKLCKRKLSLHNYTALHGAFYCEVHYQQLAKARGGSKKEKIECKQQDHSLHREPELATRTTLSFLTT